MKISALIMSLALVVCGGTINGQPAEEATTGAPPPEAAPSDDEAETEPPPTGSAAPVCDTVGLVLEGHFRLSHYPGQDAVGPNGERPIGMSKDYMFTADTYTMDGYPALRITGGYEVIARDGLRLQVRLTDTVFDGSPRPDRDIWVAFTDCGQTLEMENMTYTRVAAP